MNADTHGLGGALINRKDTKSAKQRRNQGARPSGRFNVLPSKRLKTIRLLPVNRAMKRPEGRAPIPCRSSSQLTSRLGDCSAEQRSRTGVTQISNRQVVSTLKPR